MISVKLVEKFGLHTNLQFLISAIVAAITVGGKAIGKEIAKRNSTSIVFGFRKSIREYKK